MRISVVIPVYNVEKYLDECLESVINQTLDSKYYEIIAVDDGSTDSCPTKLDWYAETHDNLIVIHQKNKGLSVARNSGINIASGEYITFIDSDDWISNRYLEDMYNLAVKINADIVCVNEKRYYHSGDEKIDYSAHFSFVKCKKNNVDLLFNNKVKTYAWGKLYKLKLFNINNIRYPEGLLYEDMATTYRLFDKANCTAFIKNNNYYFYRFRENSIVNNVKKKNIDDSFLILNDLKNYCFLHQPKYLDVYLLFKYSELMKNIICSDLEESEKKEYIKKLYLQVKGVKLKNIVYDYRSLRILLIKMKVLHIFIRIKYWK